MFFEYRQNNSGGVFGLPAISVIIEADSAEEANRTAEYKAGLYFDGDGDCSCCGDRWYSLWSDERGDEVPTHYGEPIDLDNYEAHWAAESDGVPSLAIYYANGEVVTR